MMMTRGSFIRAGALSFFGSTQADLLRAAAAANAAPAKAKACMCALPVWMKPA